jgi:hypothetical protein
LRLIDERSPSPLVNSTQISSMGRERRFAGAMWNIRVLQLVFYKNWWAVGFGFKV